MDSLLEAARTQVARFLIPGLTTSLALGNSKEQDGSELLRTKSQQTIALSNGSLRITGDIAPGIEQVLLGVCRSLLIPRELVDLFVYPSSELGAFCVLNDIPLTLAISSSLVTILSGAELAFVLGHELGHRLFRETSQFSEKSGCLEDAIYARAVEMTVDRVGLFAAADQDAAFRAILKTLSGLTGDNLRFDFGHLLSEARDLGREKISEQDLWSSHPPLAQRFRALVAFSLSDAYLTACGKEASGGTPIERVNEFVTRKLADSVDRHAHALIDSSLADLFVWLVCFLALSSQKVSISALRESCRIHIDRASVQRAFAFVSAYAEEQRDDALQTKIAEAMSTCLRLAPRRTADIMKRFAIEHPEFQFDEICAIKVVDPRFNG